MEDKVLFFYCMMSICSVYTLYVAMTNSVEGFKGILIEKVLLALAGFVNLIGVMHLLGVISLNI